MPLVRVPGYRLGPRLGGGPTADVYAATGPAEKSCAVKVLRTSKAFDPTILHLFRREARICLGLNHPCLVRALHAVTELSSPYFIVFERLHGHTVREQLQRTEWIHPTIAGSIVVQVAQGLAEMHRMGLIHADVKPENIHVGVDGRAKLIDLGFAHRPGEDEGMLGEGYVLGTANYIAPELCHRDEPEGPASDIFALGITLFEMVTGTLPYPEGTVEQTMLRHRDSRPESLSRWHGRWPAGLCELIDSMTAHSAGDRPSASMVAHELSQMFQQRSRAA